MNNNMQLALMQLLIRAQDKYESQMLSRALKPDAHLYSTGCERERERNIVDFISKIHRSIDIISINPTYVLL